MKKKLKQAANPTSEDFKSLIITSIRENSEVTIETARMINIEITSQDTRKLEEIRENLNTQKSDVINSAIAEKVLPSIQNLLGVQRSGSNSMRDHKSGRINRSPGVHFSNMDRQSGRLDNSPGGRFSQMGNRSKGLVKSPGEHFSQLDHQDRSK